MQAVITAGGAAGASVQDTLYGTTCTVRDTVSVSDCCVSLRCPPLLHCTVLLQTERLPSLPLVAGTSGSHAFPVSSLAPGHAAGAPRPAPPPAGGGGPKLTEAGRGSQGLHAGMSEDRGAAAGAGRGAPAASAAAASDRGRGRWGCLPYTGGGGEVEDGAPEALELNSGDAPQAAPRFSPLSASGGGPPSAVHRGPAPALGQAGTGQAGEVGLEAGGDPDMRPAAQRVPAILTEDMGLGMGSNVGILMSAEDGLVGAPQVGLGAAVWMAARLGQGAAGLPGEDVARGFAPGCTRGSCLLGTWRRCCWRGTGRGWGLGQGWGEGREEEKEEE